MVHIDASNLNTRQLNQRLKELARDEKDIVVLHPSARHNLAVGLFWPGNLRFEGSVGYFCSALSDGPTVEIAGNASWFLAENMMAGSVTVNLNSGLATGSALRGATIIIKGNAGGRLGQVMKDGLIFCHGNAGFMTGYMMMGGKIVILGDADHSLGESIISGEIFVGSEIASLGKDAILSPPTDKDHLFLRDLLVSKGIVRDGKAVEEAIRKFKKVVSGKALHHYARKEY